MFDDDYIGKLICGIKDYNKYEEQQNGNYWDWQRELRQKEVFEVANKSIQKTFKEHLDYEMAKYRKELEERFK